MRFSILPTSLLTNLNVFVSTMLSLLQDTDGGFKNQESDSKGCFSTIEGLYPLLLHPQSEKWHQHIFDGIEFILQNTENGKISPAPEYPDVIDNCCVDSMAYGLYVLTLVRHYIKEVSILHNEKTESTLLDKINKQIKLCIKYIEQNQNKDGGWALVKTSLEDLKSRTYSTALAIFALSNCNKADYTKENKDGRGLIISGVNFLIDNNQQAEGMWFFSQPRKGDDHKLIDLKKKPSVNLTAVVIFSLAHLLRTDWKVGWDKNIYQTILKGAQYIYEETFKGFPDEGALFVGKDYEAVDYPAYNKDSSGIIIKTKGHNNIKEGFAFPYEMILPALVLTPGYSVKSRELMALRNNIYNKLDDIQKSGITGHWKLYDYSDKVFALLYHNYIETLLEESLDLFVKTAGVFRCAVDGNKMCLHVITASQKCPYKEDSIKDCPYIWLFIKQKSFNCQSRVKKIITKWWRKLSDWAKVLLFQAIIVYITFRIFLHLGSKQLFDIQDNLHISVYMLIQGGIFYLLKNLFVSKSKNGPFGGKK